MGGKKFFFWGNKQGFNPFCVKFFLYFLGLLKKFIFLKMGLFGNS